MKNEKHTVVIEKIVLGGQGLARLMDGLVVLVPFVLPGETVEIEVFSKKKQHALARLLEVIEPSDHRTVPTCQYYSSCGGCDLQHTSYSNQLSLKIDCFHETLAREIAPDLFLEIQFEPVLGCDNELNYRQRIRLQRDSYGELGFYRKGSHEVIDIDSCPLAVSELNSVLCSLKEGDQYSVIDNAHAVELLFSPVDRSVIVVLHLLRKPRAADKTSAERIFSEIDLVKSVWISVEGFALSGPYQADDIEDNGYEKNIGFFLEGLSQSEKLKFTIEAGGFCQVNLSQNQKLVQLLLEWIDDFKIKGRAVDLFSGMGNFSLPLAQSGFDVTAMDVQRSAIRSAQSNAELNSINNCFFERSDAFSAIKNLIKDKQKFDLVLLDPPRQGCKNIISNLPSLGAEYIIYISCDPATVARDLSQLSTVGYSIKRCQGVDMFPQTHHIESISLLKLSC